MRESSVEANQIKLFAGKGERQFFLLLACSHDLARLVLDRAKLGTHFNEKGETVDMTQEEKNFRYAGIVLADIGLTIIYKYPSFVVT